MHLSENLLIHCMFLVHRLKQADKLRWCWSRALTSRRTPLKENIAKHLSRNVAPDHPSRQARKSSNTCPEVVQHLLDKSSGSRASAQSPAELGCVLATLGRCCRVSTNIGRLGPLANCGQHPTSFDQTWKLRVTCWAIRAPSGRPFARIVQFWSN